MLADFLTKPERPTAVLEAFLREGTVSLVPTVAQEEAEARRLELCRGQRQRAKDRKELQMMAFRAGSLAKPQAATEVCDAMHLVAGLPT